MVVGCLFVGDWFWAGLFIGLLLVIGTGFGFWAGWGSGGFWLVGFLDGGLGGVVRLLWGLGGGGLVFELNFLINWCIRLVSRFWFALLCAFRWFTSVLVLLGGSSPLSSGCSINSIFFIIPCSIPSRFS